MLSQATGNGAGAKGTQEVRRVFDQRAKQQLNRGYSDGMARGMEIVLAPLLLGAIGWLIDGWLGTGKFFTILFGTIGVSGTFLKLKLGYDRQMVAEEKDKPWTRGRTGEEPAA